MGQLFQDKHMGYTYFLINKHTNKITSMCDYTFKNKKSPIDIFCVLGDIKYGDIEYVGYIIDIKKYIKNYNELPNNMSPIIHNFILSINRKNKIKKIKEKIKC
jgi:hypothetical protein